MKKVMLIIILLIVMLFSLSGCSNKELSENDKEYIQRIKQLRKEQEDIELLINSRKAELATITEQINQKQIVLNGKAKYVMKLNVSQSHFSLDISEHLKDAMNDIDIYVEVSEDYYNKYNIGDTISDEFRYGSLIFKGSFGSWQIKVVDKKIIEEE